MDIVEKLRAQRGIPLYQAAADEIERLRNLLNAQEQGVSSDEECGEVDSFAEMFEGRKFGEKQG